MRASIVHPDARDHTNTLRLNKDLSLGTFMRSHLLAEVIIGAQEPLTIPAMLVDSALDL